MRLAFVCLLGAALYGQTASNRMEIKVELRKEGTWKQVDAATVFEKDAQVRFRVRTNFPGYLYVMNQGTTGAYTLLFPREDTGNQNRVDPDRDYIVPASGAFKVTGPAGHDIVYWMVTPVAITSSESRPPASSYVPLPPPPPPGTKLNTLMPRCDDSIFKARGECIDSTAGPRKVSSLDDLPENLKDVQGLKSRELVFIKEKGSAVVSTPGNLKGPVIYEFRLSHK